MNSAITTNRGMRWLPICMAIILLGATLVFTVDMGMSGDGENSGVASSTALSQAGEDVANAFIAQVYSPADAVFTSDQVEKEFYRPVAAKPAPRVVSMSGQCDLSGKGCRHKMPEAAETVAINETNEIL